MSIWWCCCADAIATDWLLSGYFEEGSGTNYVNFDSNQGSWLWFGREVTVPDIPSRRSGHLAFTITGVNSGDTLTSATLIFGDSRSNIGTIKTGGGLPADSTYYARANVYAEDIDNAPASYGSAAAYRSATRTTASVAVQYSVQVITSTQVPQYTAGTTIPSVDVTAPVQEVINRAGWTSGNRIRLLFDELNSSYGTTGGNNWGTMYYYDTLTPDPNIQLVIA